MSKASRGDPFLAETNEGQEVDAVFQGHADGKGSEDLPEGLETLRNAYREFWAETHHPIQTPSTDDSEEKNAITPRNAILQNEAQEVRSRRAAVKPESVHRRKTSPPNLRNSKRQTRQTTSRGSKRRAGLKSVGKSDRAKQRFGLPEGFVPRMQRFGRGVLLELNVYTLPNGQEFIPCLPTGPLGSRHLYALLTSEQHLRGSRGSIYVRGDGKIFDYSEVSSNPLGDMFDTGYTIYDLERTGRYAPELGSSRQTSQVVPRLRRPGKQKPLPKKSRRAASAG